MITENIPYTFLSVVNSYVYSGNNPGNLIDPGGAFFKKLWGEVERTARGVRDGFRAFGDSKNLKAMLIIAAATAAAAFTGGAAASAFASGPVTGLLIGAVVGAATGGAVGGVLFEVTNTGDFKDGAIAGAVSGAIAGAMVGASEGNFNAKAAKEARFQKLVAGAKEDNQVLRDFGKQNRRSGFKNYGVESNNPLIQEMQMRNDPLIWTRQGPNNRIFSTDNIRWVRLPA